MRVVVCGMCTVCGMRAMSCGGGTVSVCVSGGGGLGLARQRVLGLLGCGSCRLLAREAGEERGLGGCLASASHLGSLFLEVEY